MSLRARLLLGLLVLVAGGLLVADVATYAAQRSFLFGQVDQQVRDAIGPVTAKLGVNGGGQFSGGGGSAGPAPSRGATADDNDADNGPHGPGRGPHVPEPAAFLPNGTYGVRVDSAGRTVGRAATFNYDERATAPPALPRHFPVTRPGGSPRLFTVSSTAGSSLRYRAIGLASASGGATVVAVPLGAADQTLHRLLRVELEVAAGVLLALALLALLVIRFGLRPLERMGRVAGEIAGGDLSRRVSPDTPRTEVGRLGMALNGMLVTIEQAFADRRASEDRLRRFLADASHELRTPLASIRGYAELFRLGAVSGDADVERAMLRIESEAKRMGVLVEDLLLLARLDELPEARTELVKPMLLAEHAASDARAAAPDRAIVVVGDTERVVRGDPGQLHQVLANLLANAIAHTPAASPIAIDVHDDGARVAIDVRDHGPGLPDAVGDRIFERFWRTDPGRSRGRAGAGLGLAIVQAIVHAHGGEVHAENAADGGAIFHVLLPAWHGAAGDTGDVADGQRDSQANLTDAPA